MQKPDPQEDLRIRRTRKSLQEALIALTVEKGFSTITIRDITERAMVNRSTFYRHYLDKCDLLQQYIGEVYELLLIDRKEIVRLEGENTSRAVPAGLLRLLKHVQQDAAFYRKMLGTDGDVGFTADFRQNLEKRFQELARTQSVEDTKHLPPQELRIQYVAHASVGAIVWWLENDLPCSAEQLTSWISQLCYPIWSGTLTLPADLTSQPADR